MELARTIKNYERSIGSDLDVGAVVQTPDDYGASLNLVRVNLSLAPFYHPPLTRFR